MITPLRKVHRLGFVAIALVLIAILFLAARSRVLKRTTLDPTITSENG